MRFAWDPKKAAVNERKHGVTFQQAASVFGDPLAITFDDPECSVGEFRYLTFGQSIDRRLLVVAHCQRGETTRIISARVMKREELRIYEQG